MQAAGPQNTRAHDIDGDGLEELLIADRNYIRAVRYDDAPAEGSSPGWQVIEQLNADRDAKLVSVASTSDGIIAADQEGRRLLVFKQAGDGWEVIDEIGVRGLTPRAIEGGAFTGRTDQENLLLMASDAFAIASLGEGQPTLSQSGFWRPDDLRKVPHELAFGDVNGDGYADLVSLDAGEQMVDILSFSDLGKLHPMTSFKAFESKIFSAGAPREFEPRQAIVVDVTGDGLDDIVLLAHDRVLIYPQEKGESD